jgi:peptidoglycan/xylan/chitin deacetylase (PgdA/CDA1 family)
MFRVRRKLANHIARRTFLGPGPGGPARRTVLVYFDYEREFGNPLALASAETGFRGVLDVLDRTAVRATWCSVGLIADAYPGTLVELRDRGHELACHTYSHRPVTQMSSRELRGELLRFRERCAAVCGATVLGFHAPLDRWALSLPDDLRSSGYAYDIARDDDPRRLHAHRLAAPLRSPAGEILRIPSVADDWLFISANADPAAMTEAWLQKVRNVPLGRTIAIGFHPWVLGLHPSRLAAFAELIDGLRADETIALATGAQIWKWYAGDRSH